MTKRVFHSIKPRAQRTFAPPTTPNRSAWYKPANDAKSEMRSSKRWQALRDSYYSENPLCHICGKIADEVHHISMDIDLFFVRDNLASLCEDCHKGVHEAYRRGIAAETIFGRR